MTSSACKVCGRPAIVGMQCAVRINSKWRTWRECVTCFLKDKQ